MTFSLNPLICLAHSGMYLTSNMQIIMLTMTNVVTYAEHEIIV